MSSEASRISPAISSGVPEDFSYRIKIVRGIKGLTQTQFADLIGVSFASINRWENGQSRPNKLAWQKIVDLELPPADGTEPTPDPVSPLRRPTLTFSSNPDAVAAVAEAHRLAYGHMFNHAFATETSRIDPLPHQRLAVYEHMLSQSPLRFLLADDAGAGKTIMTGLYVREMLSRRLIRRVLIVPPAGLVGNWEREMRTLFRLQFRIVIGADARDENPFVGQESDLAIVSVDTLTGERMFGRLQEAATEPYDLVVFDEAHKLSARWERNSRVAKTERYKLAEALAGADTDSDPRWQLHWSARHLLLLTATPHMGKDHPYYFLWRLLLPETLPTYDAFDGFPHDARQQHFIRRTKEEMVRFDGTPLYPKRNCDTLSYDLTQGPASEQELYDETTDYIQHYYNRAQHLNRSAARLAMSVFQRRLASSTYALLRSFERRKEKIELLIDDVRSGRLTQEQLVRQQHHLDGKLEDSFETRTADEDTVPEDDREQHEDFESEALGATIATSLAELEVELQRVEDLLGMARSLSETGAESKFEKLHEVLQNPEYADQKIIIFTEHRDTADFLRQRLEGLGFTGQVAQIHGGLPYQAREREVEFFRKPATEGGANYLIATDAAGEGINLQFCWLMVNYDIPWNPARLEQRMGRIHRYGQEHDPVIIVNLIAGETREGQVLKTLLDKLEAIRRQLDSDKVFDVIGRLFENKSLKAYLDQAISEGGSDAAVHQLESSLTEDQVQTFEQNERLLFGEGGEISNELSRLNEEAKRENYLRLLPGYVQRFVDKAAPLLDLEIDGNLNETFSLAPVRARALDPLLSALEYYPEEARNQITVHKPQGQEEVIWLHPGERIFDGLSTMIRNRYAGDALQGAVFVDPHADEPYLFHMALVEIERTEAPAPTNDLLDEHATHAAPERSTIVESRLIGLKQAEDGAIEECPVEHLLLLRGDPEFPPGQVRLAALARGMVREAETYAREEIAETMVQSHRYRLTNELRAQVDSVSRGYGYQSAALAAARTRLTEKARSGESNAAEELSRIKERQRNLAADRERHLANLQAEPDRIRVGDIKTLVHTLVVPSQDPQEIDRFDIKVEKTAMNFVIAYEEGFGAEVKDVSRPELARSAGFKRDWPGFDLLSNRPDGQLSIEVKGRAGVGEVGLSENEWAEAATIRDDYWLYVVYDCATPNPRLVRVQDPFEILMGKTKGGVVINSSEILAAAAPDETKGSKDASSIPF